MFIVACLIFVVLACISVTHIYWAFGGAWPAPKRELLSRAVAGVDSDRMPPAMITLIVAGMIFAVGCLPLVWVGTITVPISQGIIQVLMWIAVAVFGIRGIATYMFYNRLYNVVEPFKRLNRIYFSPLCLLIAAGFVYLLA